MNHDVMYNHKKSFKNYLQIREANSQFGKRFASL